MGKGWIGADTRDVEKRLNDVSLRNSFSRLSLIDYATSPFASRSHLIMKVS